MTVNLRRTFYYPVFCFFFVEATFITDPIFHFAPLVFTCGYTEYLIASHPQTNFAAASRTIAMRIYCFGKPYAIFETECFICQCTYRAYIYHITDKFVIQ